MRIKFLSIFLLFFGLLHISTIINAQDNVLEINSKKDGSNLIMYFDLNENGTLYITNSPSKLYHFILVNPDNKIEWESDISKKEWKATGKVKVHYTEKHIYFIQLGGFEQSGLAIMQFDAKGNKKIFENLTREFDRMKTFFTDDNKLYTIHDKLEGNGYPVYYFMPFNADALTPEKSVKVKLPESIIGEWHLMGFDEEAYFYGIANNYNDDGSINAHVFSVTVSGRVSDEMIININPEEGKRKIDALSSYPQLELDDYNHCIYAFGLIRNENVTTERMFKYVGVYIQKYHLDGELIYDKYMKFKELNKIYPQFKEQIKGDLDIALILNPLINSAELLTQGFTKLGGSLPTYYDISSYKLDSTFRLKKVVYVSSVTPSMEIARLELYQRDYLVSVILGNTPYNQNKDDAVIRKLTELTTENNNLKKKIVYNLKYYEDHGIVMEYIAREKLLKLHSVKL